MSTGPRNTNETADLHRPLLITFSGLDGSGKSTQIENVRQYLSAAKKRVVMLAFWDDAVVGKRYRENFVHKVYGSEKGIGTPGKPVQRRDKNMRGWYLSLVRHGLYLLDAIHVCEVIARARRGSPDVIIMDRYIYDELVNLPLRNPISRFYVRAISSFVPKPELALLMDADPQAARERKPEYPVEFMKEARLSYFRLASFVGRLTVIPPMSLEDAKGEVLSALHRVISATSRPGMQAGGDLAAA
ncbi:MAG: thymidylate kinase [Acidobacteriales bacterium]|nr:thymidylate kinase [Terriglobales bacterium]